MQGMKMKCIASKTYMVALHMNPTMQQSVVRDEGFQVVHKT
ncbi:hypothetical protein LINPERPRIM_LOCUS1660 [Linum perenne]